MNRVDSIIVPPVLDAWIPIRGNCWFETTRLYMNYFWELGRDQNEGRRTQRLQHTKLTLQESEQHIFYN